MFTLYLHTYIYVYTYTYDRCWFCYFSCSVCMVIIYVHTCMYILQTWSCSTCRGKVPFFKKKHWYFLTWWLFLNWVFFVLNYKQWGGPCLLSLKRSAICCNRLRLESFANVFTWLQYQSRLTDIPCRRQYKIFRSDICAVHKWKDSNPNFDW
jgi:hypothetical protein